MCINRATGPVWSFWNGRDWRNDAMKLTLVILNVLLADKYYEHISLPLSLSSKTKIFSPRLSLTPRYLQNTSYHLGLSRLQWFSVQHFRPGLGAMPLERTGRWGNSSFLGISALKPIRETFWPSGMPYFVVASHLVPCPYHWDKEALLLTHQEWRRTYRHQGLGLNCIY